MADSYRTLGVPPDSLERGGVGLRWRWIEETTPVDPALNMARDAALLQQMLDVPGLTPLSLEGRGVGGEGFLAASGPRASVGDEILPAVRVYRWSTPAVTVGRLQNEDDVRAAFPGLTLVRRPTGGRAVLHGDDLTVSVATREEWLPGTPGTVASSYQVIVTGLIDALRRHGIDAIAGDRRRLRPDSFPSRFGRGAEERGGVGSVDCFAAVASCDIADASTGAKLVGSAQRRERGAILQQMSIHAGVIARIGSLSTFVDDLRDCLKSTLKVDCWEFVDFDSPVCYTVQAG